AGGRCARGQLPPDQGGRYRRGFKGQVDQAAVDGGQLPAQGGGGLQYGAGPLGYGQVDQAGDILPGVPGAEVFELVGAQYPVILGAGRQLAQRVYGVAGAASFDLDGVDAQPGFIAYGQRQHGQPVFGAGGQRCALPGVGGRDQL